GRQLHRDHVFPPWKNRQSRRSSEHAASFGARGGAEISRPDDCPKNSWAVGRPGKSVGATSLLPHRSKNFRVALFEVWPPCQSNQTKRRRGLHRVRVVNRRTVLEPSTFQPGTFLPTILPSHFETGPILV